MPFEHLKIKATAAIKLFKDFAKQYTHRAASGVRSLGNSPPIPEEKLPKKPTARAAVLPRPPLRRPGATAREAGAALGLSSAK